ncbi:MAG: phosphoglucomutase [Legionellales bacterium RIFCSPHIGHO2_12_FULL_37_14]|nr:MAG: phosphoglucomutase [Legionellales bacterium RIFCSPHIGHO2_12_FULL_37_14]
MDFKKVLVSKSVFRAYDIRGLVETELTRDALYTIGIALAFELQALKRSKVFVARDGRLSSLALVKALTQGLMDEGINVIDLGAVSTPILYFATQSQEVDSGFIVTGSHNPAEYNGLKMVLACKTLVNADITRLYERVVTLQDASCVGTKKGSYTSKDIFPEYKARILSDVKLARPLKVVVDCGHGIAGPFVPDVLTSMGCEVIPLYCEVDGRFPAHHPDPTVEANLVFLKQAVVKHKADIGLGFDGDGDRLGVVTERGEIIWPDRLMMFYIKDILQRHPQANIVFDVKCSKKLIEMIKELGGHPTMCPTGHSIVKGVMQEVNAPLAGEMSGHLFFKDRWYGFDDALYSACRLLELVALKNATVSQQFSAIPVSVSTPELKIPIEETQKFELMRRFSEEISFADTNRITIDGVRVEFAKGWGLLRASNTTPCLVARFEADSQADLQSIQDMFKDALLSLAKGLTLPF